MTLSALTAITVPSCACLPPSCCLPVSTNCIHVCEQPWSLGKLRARTSLPVCESTRLPVYQSASLPSLPVYLVCESTSLRVYESMGLPSLPSPRVYQYQSTQSASIQGQMVGRGQAKRVWMRTLLLLFLMLLQHSSKRSLVSGCQSMQLASSSSVLLPLRRKHHQPYCTGIIQVSLQHCVLLPRHPVSTEGPPSGLAHPSQQVWLSHAHHETPEQSKISRLDGRSHPQQFQERPFAASSPVACLVGVAPAEALTATGGLLSSSSKSCDPRRA